MKNSSEYGKIASPWPLALGLAVGMGALAVSAKDCRDSNERKRVREGVLVLQEDNHLLDSETKAIGTVVIINDCRTAYASCLDGAKLSVGCNRADVDAVCEAELSGYKSINDLHCCYEIQMIENSCKRNYRDCLRDQVVDL